MRELENSSHVFFILAEVRRQMERGERWPEPLPSSQVLHSHVEKDLHPVMRNRYGAEFWTFPDLLPGWTLREQRSERSLQAFCSPGAIVCFTFNQFQAWELPVDCWLHSRASCLAQGQIMQPMK